MMSYGCVECLEQTADTKERFIIPFTHHMFCEKHRPNGSIPLSEFFAYGASWSKWTKVKNALKKQKMGGVGIA